MCYWYFSEYPWVVPLKDKTGVSIVDAFQKILDYSKRKSDKIWVDKGSEFYNNSFWKWLKDNDIEMYSIHNEGKSVVAEKFIRTVKTKIYKYMTSVPKNLYIDKLDDIVGEYNNTYHRTIKMKPVDVKDNTYIDFKKEVNDKDYKVKAGDHVRISKYRNNFAKGYTPNWSEEIRMNHLVEILMLKLIKLLNWANYATKADIKDISHVDTSSFALKTNLGGSLKIEVHKLDIDKKIYMTMYMYKVVKNVVKNVFKKWC